MIRVKVRWAELDGDEAAVVRTSYAARVGHDGRITQTDPREARAVLLTEAEAERVARYYRRHPKPGRIVYEEALAHAAD